MAEKDGRNMKNMMTTNGRMDDVGRRQAGWRAWILLVCLIAGMMFLLQGETVDAAGTELQTYYITPKTAPCNDLYPKMSTYNAYTKHYYLIRSYMEKLEEEGGGTLVLRKGTYTITNTIGIPSNVKLICNDGVVIKKGLKTDTAAMPPSNSIFMLCAPSKLAETGVYSGYQGEKNIVIRGRGTVVFDMQNYKAKGGATPVLIEGAHNKNVKISNITFRNMYNGHFIELDASYKYTIDGCTFEEISGTVLREAINLDTPDESTGGFSAQWSSMDCTANHTVTIKNCVFRNMSRAIGTHNYSEGHWHKKIVIDSCTFEGIRRYAIDAMYWRASAIRNCTIVGTTEESDGVKPATDAEKPYGMGIFATGIYGLMIQNNHIENFYEPVVIKPLNEGADSIYNPVDNALSEANITAFETNTCRNCGIPEVLWRRAETDKWSHTVISVVE